LSIREAGFTRERKTNQFSIFLIKVAAFKGILDGDKISVWPATGLFGGDVGGLSGAGKRR
jgi:hypothetical protein